LFHVLGVKATPTAQITGVSTVEAEIGESLAAVGIFGLMGQLVARRSPEIGLRMALGATPGDVLRMVLSQGLLFALAGGVAGICGVFLVARVLKSMLYGVGAADPVSYGVAGIVMALALLLACGVPGLACRPG
jgi:putative ABC transport system permease protein